MQLLSTRRVIGGTVHLQLKLGNWKSQKLFCLAHLSGPTKMLCFAGNTKLKLLS